MTTKKEQGEGIRFNFNKENLELNLVFETVEGLEEYLLTMIESFEWQELCLMKDHKKLLHIISEKHRINQGPKE